jgi:hypothetical protein
MVSTLNPGKLCWIDQSGMQDNERSLWGWSLRGLLCLGIKPARATEKSNIMAGLMQGKLIAPIQYATNTTAMIVEDRTYALTKEKEAATGHCKKRSCRCPEHAA